MGGNDQNRAEKLNVVLTWFRPVTWSSGHLGRRFESLLHVFDFFRVLGSEETGGILFQEYCFGEENSLSLTEFYGKLGELWKIKLCEFALAHK